jgi:uncharacterized membrane protein
MKTNQKPDKRIHIRKKVAGGTTGAVLGAVVGGPVGALVGGVIGTVMGGAAESGKLRELASKGTAGKGKPVAKAKTAARRVAKKVRPTVQRAAQKVRARPARTKSRSRG